MNKINLRCDVHMYQKINQMQNLCFCDYTFGGDVLCFHPNGKS